MLIFFFVCRQATYEVLLHHVILPRVLSTVLEKNNIEEQELMLVADLTASIEQCAKYLPPSIIMFFRKFKQLHNNRDAKLVSQQINELQPGETFAMLLKKQHTVFMIHMPKEKSGIANIATFPSRCDAKQVYDYLSSDLNMDLQVRIPLFCIKMIKIQIKIEFYSFFFFFFLSISHR